MTMLSIPAVGGLVASAAMGPVGLVVYGTAGTIIATQLGRLVKEKLVPQAIASLYSKILEKVGEKVGNAAAGVVVGSFSVTAQGIRRFMGYCKETENDNFLEEWIDTLLLLPEDIMPDLEKKEIREVLGLEYDATLSTQLASHYSLALH